MPIVGDALHPFDQHVAGRVFALFKFIAHHRHFGIEILFCNKGVHHPIRLHLQGPLQIIVTRLKQIKIISAVERGSGVAAKTAFGELLVQLLDFRGAFKHQMFQQVRHPGFAVIFMA